MPRVRVIGLSTALVTAAIVGGVVLDAVASAASPLAPASTPSTAVDPSTTATPARSGTRQPSEYCLAFRSALAANLGVTQDQLVAAARKAAGTAIDRAVADGKLRQAAANRIKARIKAAPASGCRILAGWRGSIERRMPGAATGAGSTPAVSPAP